MKRWGLHQAHRRAPRQCRYDPYCSGLMMPWRHTTAALSPCARGTGDFERWPVPPHPRAPDWTHCALPPEATSRDRRMGQWSWSLDGVKALSSHYLYRSEYISSSTSQLHASDDRSPDASVRSLMILQAPSPGHRPGVARAPARPSTSLRSALLSTATVLSQSHV